TSFSQGLSAISSHRDSKPYRPSSRKRRFMSSCSLIGHLISKLVVRLKRVRPHNDVFMLLRREVIGDGRGLAPGRPSLVNQLAYRTKVHSTASDGFGHGCLKILGRTALQQLKHSCCSAAQVYASLCEDFEEALCTWRCLR